MVHKFTVIFERDTEEDLEPAQKNFEGYSRQDALQQQFFYELNCNADLLKKCAGQYMCQDVRWAVGGGYFIIVKFPFIFDGSRDEAYESFKALVQKGYDVYGMAGFFDIQLPTHTATVRVPSVWRKLIELDELENNIKKHSSRKHSASLDDPEPYSDDVRVITGSFSNGATFSLGLCSTQNNYYGGLNIFPDHPLRGQQDVGAVLKAFEDQPGSKTLTVIGKGPEKYVLNIEWEGEVELDDFLQDACMKLHDMWTKAGGAELTQDGLQALNDTLSAFFGDINAS
jgi:hypothetical protein